MNRILNITKFSYLLCFFTMLFFFSGCVTVLTTFTQGGKVVPKGYNMQKVIVAYRAEGAVPTRVQYFLIETYGGLAMFERSEDGSGTLFQTRWQDDQGDHFAAWVCPPVIPLKLQSSKHFRGGPAYEFVVPFDRSKEAKRFQYQKGKFTIQIINGIARPVPKDPEIKIVATLIPK
jgi:hypothetical protein